MGMLVTDQFSFPRIEQCAAASGMKIAPGHSTIASITIERGIQLSSKNFNLFDQKLNPEQIFQYFEYLDKHSSHPTTHSTPPIQPYYYPTPRIRKRKSSTWPKLNQLNQIKLFYKLDQSVTHI